MYVHPLLQHCLFRCFDLTPIAFSAAMTAYDYPGALACRGSDVDVVLVGDSVANVVYGYERTSDLSIEEMIVSIRAVARALRSPALTHSPYAPPMLLADLVYGTYESSTKDGVQAAIGLIRAGADGIKVEGGAEALELISALGEYGVPVMAHIGLRPQRAPALTGFRVQGGSASAALQVVQDAIMAQEAGASALLVEAVPQVVGAEVSRQVKIPVVGIGAGPDTDGQILVQHDVLGDLTSPAAVLPPRFQNSTAGFGVPLAHELTPTPARFVRLFTDQAPSTAASAPEFPAACRLTVGAARLHAIASYVAAVKDRSFPAAPEVYKMRKEERAQFDELIADLIKADADVSK